MPKRVSQLKLCLPSPVATCITLIYISATTEQLLGEKKKKIQRD